MVKKAAKQFQHVLFRLFQDRTHRLRHLVESPGSGTVEELGVKTILYTLLDTEQEGLSLVWGRLLYSF